MQIFFKRDKRQWPPLPSPQDQSPTSPESLSSTRLLLFLLQINNNCSTRRQEWTFNLFHFTLVYVKLFEDWESKKKRKKIYHRHDLPHLNTQVTTLLFSFLQNRYWTIFEKKKYQKNIFCAEKILKKTNKYNIRGSLLKLYQHQRFHHFYTFIMKVAVKCIDHIIFYIIKLHIMLLQLHI